MLPANCLGEPAVDSAVLVPFGCLLWLSVWLLFWLSFRSCVWPCAALLARLLALLVCMQCSLPITWVHLLSTPLLLPPLASYSGSLFWLPVLAPCFCLILAVFLLLFLALCCLARAGSRNGSHLLSLDIPCLTSCNIAAARLIPIAALRPTPAVYCYSLSLSVPRTSFTTALVTVSPCNAPCQLHG